MAIGRTEFQFSVTGANEAAAAHRNVARAADEVGTASRRAADAVGYYDSMTMSFVSVAPKVTDATRKMGEQSAAASEKARKLREEINAIAQPANGARLAVEGLGKGLTLVQRAAYILPGFGIAGILLKIGEAASWVADQFRDVQKSTELQTAALAEYARILDVASKAVLELGRAQAEAGRSTIGGAIGVDARALSGSARMQGAEFGVERAALDARQRALDTQAGELAAAERLVRERAARLSDAVSAGIILPGQYGMANALEAEALAIGKRRRMFVSEAEKLKAAEIALQSKIEAMKVAAGLSDSQKGGKAGKPVDNSLGATVGRIAGEQTPRRGMEAGALAGIGGMMGESYDASAEAARMKAQEMADQQLAQDQRNAMMMAHMQGAPGEPAVPSIFAMLTATEEEKAAFDQQMADAGAGIKSIYAETQRLAEDGKGMLTGLGKGLSTAAAASLLTGKSFKHAANELLKSLAVQAAGQAIWETALGVGSLAMAAMGNPSAGASAALHFKAAGMFGALAVAFAGGASITGGLRDGGASSSGGGGGGSSAAVGTGGGGGRGEAPVYVSVQIGEEPVAAIMRRSNEREARRGGMSGHFAMGAA